MGALRAVTYARISADRAGQGLGVGRQRDDTAALAERSGWTLLAELTDNDVSAYSGKPRPAYRQLCTMIAAGLVDAVIAWHPDRLHRSPAELEEFIALIERHHVRVVTCQAGQWDLSTASGRLNARTLGNFARYESEHRSERVLRKLAQNAAEGTPHGRVAYGWTRGINLATGRRHDTLNAEEAAIVRGIAESILRGESINAILRDLNSRGIASPTGQPWSRGMLRHIVTRERNAALRRHHGEIIGDAEWDAILTRSEWEQVCAILSDPARRTSTGSTAAHLLSGIAKCAVCGEGIRATKNRTVDSYKCPAGHVTRNRRDVDSYVVGIVTGVLGKLDASALGPDAGAVQAAAEVERLQQRLDDAADAYADGALDRRGLERVTARVRPLLDAAQARARVVDDSALLAGLIGGERAAQAWAELSLSRRRAIVEMLCSVTIGKTSPGIRRFDPKSVNVEPKEFRKA